FELRNGMISWLGEPQAERLRPTGPFDPDFPVMAFEHPDHSLAAVIFGHSTHPVDTPDWSHRSPAFYGLAAQTFEHETAAITTFIEGASGSTHPWPLEGFKLVDVSVRERLTEAGRRILDAIRYHVDQAPEMPVARVESLKREVTVQVRNFDEE